MLEVLTYINLRKHVHMSVLQCMNYILSRVLHKAHLRFCLSRSLKWFHRLFNKYSSVIHSSLLVNLTNSTQMNKSHNLFNNQLHIIADSAQNLLILSIFWRSTWIRPIVNNFGIIFHLFLVMFAYKIDDVYFLSNICTPMENWPCISKKANTVMKMS